MEPLCQGEHFAGDLTLRNGRGAQCCTRSALQKSGDESHFLRYCRELATQIAHVAKLVNIELSPQPLGDRRVDVEVEHVTVPRLEAELAVEGDADPAHFGAVAVAAIL
jgi:hypothetical protein